MTNRLNDILRKCSNIKFKTNYIKYLRSLDFEEYEKIFVFYTLIIQTVIIRYNDSKIFTKKWFKKQLLLIKFNQLYNIFSEANLNYLIKVKNNLEFINKKREKILIDIKNNRESLNNVLQEVFIRGTNDINKSQALIYFNISIIDNIYLTTELERLTKELNRLNNYPN